MEPVRDPAQPVPVSASMLEAVMVCPTQWFLTTEAGGAGAAHQSANIGQLVHALAQRVAAGEVPPDLDLLMGHVDEVWGRLHFRTPWSAKREHERIEVALTRFLEWHGANPRKLVGTEEKFETVVELESGERVRLNGYADRLELDADGRVVVVDLKTTKDKPTGPQLQRHVQLGVYQYAVDQGAVDLLAPDGHGESGGAELVQLGLPDGDSALVQQQPAYPDDGPERASLRGHLERASSLVRQESFPAVAGEHCRDCDFRLDLPDPGRRVGDVPVKISTPQELGALMQLGLRAQSRAVGGDPRAARAGRRDRRGRLRQDHPDGRAGRLPRRDGAGAPRPGAGPDLHHQGREPAARQGPRGAAGRRAAARAERRHR